MAQANGEAPRQPTAVLLQVSIETVPAQRSCTASTPPMRPAGGAIEIEVGNARVRLRGSVDEASLRTVLMALRSLT
jgi:transposase